MNLHDYQIAAERTMTADTTPADRLVNAALGLCGEATELIEQVESSWGAPDLGKIIKEAGDVAWYCAQACNALGASVATLPEPTEAARRSEPDRLLHVAGKVSDIAKKFYFHTAPQDRPQFLAERRAELSQHLADILEYVRRYLALYGVPLEFALARNIQKLLKRHRDGFTFASAAAKLDEQVAK